MQIYHITNQREKNTETLQQHFSFITIRMTCIYKRCQIYIARFPCAEKVQNLDLTADGFSLNPKVL